LKTGEKINKSIIVLKHDDYTNLNDFFLGLEEAIIKGKDSYYTVIISGSVEPLRNPIFYQDGYVTLVRMADVAKHSKTRISIQINTRMPSTVNVGLDDHAQFKWSEGTQTTVQILLNAN